MLTKFKSTFANGAVRFLASNSTMDFGKTVARRRPRPNLVSSDNELNYGTREEMMSEARNLCRTFGVANRIMRQYANYCIGTCEIDFATGVPEWDEAAEEFWRTSMQIIDVVGSLNLPAIGRMMVMHMLRDGDIGFIKTTENGFPQIQAIEADRLRNSSALLDVDQDPTQVGGVKVDRIGRPLSYRVWDREFSMGYKNPREINAADFIHIKDPDRFDGVRGLTHYSRGALNHLRDLKEILQAEKKGVKMHSKIALLIKKVTGGLPRGQVSMFGTKDDGSGTNYTEEIPDGMIKYMLPDEDAVPFLSNRPSPTFAGFLEFLIHDIAISLELPVGFVWAMLGTGPAVRLESKQAERTFAGKIDLLEWQFFNPLASWVIGWAMENGQLPFNRNWYKFKFTRPSHPSIDVGRESKADMDEHERGVISGGEIAAQRGQNIFKVFEARGREGQAAMEVAKKYKVPVEWILKIPKDKVPPEPGGEGKEE